VIPRSAWPIFATLLNVIFIPSLSFFCSTGGGVLTGVGATVHGIKLGNCVTVARGGGEVGVEIGGGVGFAISAGIGGAFGAGAGVGDGAALTIGLGPGAAEALLIFTAATPPIARAKISARFICLLVPFKEIPNDYGQKYFF